MLQNSKELECLLDLKLHFLYHNLKYFPKNLETSKKIVERCAKDEGNDRGRRKADCFEKVKRRHIKGKDRFFASLCRHSKVGCNVIPLKSNDKCDICKCRN